MICLACSRPTASRICQGCWREMRPAHDRLLAGGLPMVAAFEHVGAARHLVHLLKYQGVAEVADVVASVLSPRLPQLPLVPVPRALTRRIKYGVDPATELARAIARRTGSHVSASLRSPFHTPRRAGLNTNRPVPVFSRRATSVSGGLILVDDVVTSGATVLSAARELGDGQVRLVVAANSASGGSRLRDRVTSQTPRNQ